MKRFVPRSLMVKVTIFVAMTMMVVLAVFSTVFIVSERRNIENSVLKNGITFADFSALSIYDNFVSLYTHPEASEFEIFKRRVSNTLKYDKNIDQVTLIGLNGRILFDSSELETGKYKGDYRGIKDQETLERVQAERTSSREMVINGKEVTEIIVPIAEDGGGHAVSMRYILSNTTVGEYMSGVYRRVASLIGILGVFALGVAVLFSMSLVRPIVRLNRVAAQLRSGDLAARAVITSQDEIGRLGMTLNDMATRLQQYYEDLEKKVRDRTRDLVAAQEELKKVNTNLEEKVEERTRELSEAQAQLMASVNSLPIGFVLTSAEGKVMVSNPVLKKIFGVGQQVDLSTVDPKTNELLKTVDTASRMCLAGKKLLTEERTTKDGRYLRFLHSPVFGSQSDVIGVVSLVDDITEAKVLERSKDEFFSIASHELRTPLTSIRGNTSLIQNYYKEEVKDEDIRQMVNDIHDSSVQLIDIVNDFLDVSSLEQGKIKYRMEPFNISRIVEKISYEVSATLKQKNIYLHVDETLDQLPMVYADEARTKQILYNLTGNACKFTEAGGITIKAEALNGMAKITVSDTGRGIPVDKQKLLFRKFQQAGESLLTRDTARGTGLGLYISRMLTEQMGGRLVLENSEVDKGTTFSFTLPLAKPGDKPAEVGGAPVKDTFDATQPDEGPKDEKKGAKTEAKKPEGRKEG